MMVQDEQGHRHPAGRTRDREAARDAREQRILWRTDRARPPNFIYTSNEIDRVMEEKRQAKREDIIDHNRKFNRRHFNDFYNLVERHDMRPNK
jgi:uncharacterized membrane protein